MTGPATPTQPRSEQEKLWDDIYAEISLAFGLCDDDDAARDAKHDATNAIMRHFAAALAAAEARIERSVQRLRLLADRVDAYTADGLRIRVNGEADFLAAAALPEPTEAPTCRICQGTNGLHDGATHDAYVADRFAAAAGEPQQETKP